MGGVQQSGTGTRLELEILTAALALGMARSLGFIAQRLNSYGLWGHRTCPEPLEPGAHGILLRVCCHGSQPVPGWTWNLGSQVLPGITRAPSGWGGWEPMFDDVTTAIWGHGQHWGAARGLDSREPIWRMMPWKCPGVMGASTCRVTWHPRFSESTCNHMGLQELAQCMVGQHGVCREVRHSLHSLSCRLSLSVLGCRAQGRGDGII